MTVVNKDAASVKAVRVLNSEVIYLNWSVNEKVRSANKP
jgi:hypothetical protein